MAAIPNWVRQLDAGTWRGYSAYEIAVRHGFSGTEEEWLASLKGADGQDGDEVTVNGKAAIGGNITVRATDIPIAPGMSQTVKQAIDSMPGEEELNAISREVEKKTGAVFLTCSLDKDSWTAQGEGFRQEVSVIGMTESGAVIVSPAPEDGQSLWEECRVRCVEQRENSLAFTAQEQPGESITVHLCLIDGGAGE